MADRRALTPDEERNVEHAHRYLAGMPRGSTTLTTREWRALLLSTNGIIYSGAESLTLHGKSLGAGVYSVSLRRRDG